MLFLCHLPLLPYRPGRIEKTLYVGLPNADERVKILQTITKNGVKPPINSQVSLDAIARDERCARFTGWFCYSSLGIIGGFVLVTDRCANFQTDTDILLTNVLPTIYIHPISS